MNRAKYPSRRIELRAQEQRDRAIACILNAPLDDNKPLEFILREKQPGRSREQNAYLWTGVYGDLAEQAYVNGRTYPAEVWHEHCKREFLPEEYSEELTKDGYRKWEFMPNGERVLVGSTTQLTVKGFSNYCEQIFAFGASLGVQFGIQEAA